MNIKRKIKNAVGSLRIDSNVSKESEKNIEDILLGRVCSKELKKEFLIKYQQATKG